MTTTYTAIPNGDIDQDSPLTQPLLTALRGNPIAAREGATGAAYEASAWHPYNGVTIGDGATGLIYDQSVHGTVATLETPAWADGYEYRFIYEGLRHNSGSSQSFRVEFYKSVDASYVSAINIGGSTSSGSDFNGYSEVYRPRILLATVNLVSALNIGATVKFDIIPTKLTGSNKFGKARFSYTGGSIALGKIYMQKRLCYA